MAKRFTVWFNRCLQRRPVVTNSVVYATFYTSAELLQQNFNKYYSDEKTDIDFMAAGRIALVGSCLYAPTFYFWYKYLDTKFAGTAIKTVAIKVAADQFFMTPILLAIFFTSLGLLERKDDIFEDLRNKYWTTFFANQAFWIPGQSINFYFVPPRLRVVYVASLSFLWINVICFIKRQKHEKK